VVAKIAARLARAMALCATLAAVAANPVHAQSWDEVVARARGQTVNWNAWAGDEKTNAFIAWVGTEVEKRYGVTLDPDYPHLSYGSDAKRSLIARAVIAKDGVKRVSFLPVLIDKKLRPEVLRHGDPRFDDALQFMEWVSEDFNHKFAVEGDEVLVTGR